LTELSTRHNFTYYLTVGAIYRGWARAAAGHAAEGISWLEQGIDDYRASGSIIGLSFYLTRKAEALHLANRTSEALDSIDEAEALVEKYETRWWSVELHRLRSVFLAATGADESYIQASFQAAIRAAKEQKSISLANRAKATYAEYLLQKESALRWGFRLPL
jgi:predicted ATPase